jgi:hypothetical protein
MELSEGKAAKIVSSPKVPLSKVKPEERGVLVGSEVEVPGARVPVDVEGGTTFGTALWCSSCGKRKACGEFVSQ